MQREQLPVLQEIELKLSVAPRHAASVWKSSTVSSCLNAKPVTRRLFSAYYDVPGFLFRRRGTAVRLRRESGRWMQTIKTGDSGTGGLHRRTELEMPVAAQLLHHPALAEAGLDEILAEASVRSAVGVVFTTSFLRSSAIVEPSPGNRIEIAVDRGEIIAGTRRLPICEIELELKSGEPQGLFRLARALAGEIPLRLENESKAERGYRLAAGEADRPVKAVAPDLLRDMDVDSAFQAIAASCLRHLQANERGLLESNDPEYLHQARVALRRLRCAFGVFARGVPKSSFGELLAGLKEIGRVLGDARDLDVFVEQTLTAAGRSDSTGELAGIRRSAIAAARKARSAARATMGASSYTLLMLDLAEALFNAAWKAARDEEQSRYASMPLTEFCTEVLSRRDRKARRRGNGIDRSDLGAVHLLRIEIKKLRYACEFLASLYPRRKSRDYLKRLALLQEVLGGINDAAAAVRLVHTLTSRASRSQMPTAVGYMRGYLVAQIESQLEVLAQDWVRFERARPFW
jgi:inorganic triphosphatase YgiF